MRSTRPIRPTRPTPIEIGPPVTEVGIIGWLRHNLFSSLRSSIATIVVGARARAGRLAAPRVGPLLGALGRHHRQHAPLPGGSLPARGDLARVARDGPPVGRDRAIGGHLAQRRRAHDGHHAGGRPAGARVPGRRLGTGTRGGRGPRRERRHRPRGHARGSPPPRPAALDRHRLGPHRRPGLRPAGGSRWRGLPAGREHERVGRAAPRRSSSRS